MTPTGTAIADSATRLDLLGDGIAELHLIGRQGRPFILDEGALKELESTLDALEAKSDLRGLLVLSDDPRVFCAGADVDRIAAVEDAAQAEAFSLRGQELFERLEDLHAPVVAAIHGTCVGGGLELALAADIRLASDDPATRLGLPEVRLGILPAWGGTTRLPEIVGLRRALRMLLTGETLDARRAAKAGLVIECPPPALLRARARQRLLNEIDARAHGHHGPPVARESTALDYIIDEMRPAGRTYLAAARRRVLAETRGAYPAPLAILEILAKGRGRPREERFAMERRAVGRLATSSVCRHLIGIMRRSRDKDRGGLYARKYSGSPIGDVAVVGAGVMGAGIAFALLQRGLRVSLIDGFPEALVRARRSIDQEIGQLLARRRIDRTEARAFTDRLSIGLDWQALAGADLVIEAVPEVPKIKDEVLSRIARIAAPGAIIASNTSSLSLEGLSRSVTRPERFLGLHFFNPAPKMPLVEVIRTPNVAEDTLLAVLAFARRIGKTAVLTADQPAFVVNRLLAPYLLEAMHLVAAGAEIGEVDRAARDFGLPMGPFELMDEVGLDTVLHVCRYLESAAGTGAPPRLLVSLVESGRLGRKSGSGFHRRVGRRRKALRRVELARIDPDLKPGTTQGQGSLDLRRRIEDCLRREAERMLAAGVVDGPDDLDLASIYGMGFPPFRGGIATWARESKGEGA